MDKKKTWMMIAIIIILVIIIMVGSFTLLYFMTDIFKTNQQLFWKYASNGTQLVKMLSSENEVEQKNWRENHSYTSKGDLSISVTKETGTKEIKLGTTEKHSQTTGRTYADITLYNGEEESLKASYINSNDIYAIYCKEIYEPYYIGFRNNHLKEFAEKMGLTEEIVKFPEAISFGQTEILTKEEMKYLSENYSNVFINSISEEKYHKTDKITIKQNDKDYEVVGYQVQLNQEDFRKILIDVLMKAKNDQQTITIFSKILSNKDNIDISNRIEQLTNIIQNQVLEEMNLTISVYHLDKQMTRIQVNYNEKEILLDIDNRRENKQNVTIKMNSLNSENSEISNNMQITIEKQTLDNMLLYSTDISDKRTGYRLTMNTSLGNVTDDKIENNSKITIFDNNTTIETSYYKTIQATNDDVDIEELTDTSAVVINNYPKEQLETFFKGIADRTQQVATDKIGKLNVQLTESQDGLYYAQGIISSIFVIMNANGVAQPVGTIGAIVLIELNQAVLTTQSNMNTMNNNILNQMEEQEKQAFNTKFEMYKGENINGTLVKTLLSNVINNNTNFTNDEERMVLVKINDDKIKKPEGWNEAGEKEKTKLVQLRDNIQRGNQYTIAIEYDQKGFTEMIIIMENENKQ